MKSARRIVFRGMVCSVSIASEVDVCCYRIELLVLVDEAWEAVR